MTMNSKTRSQTAATAHRAATEPGADLRPVEGRRANAELAHLARAIGHPARIQILRLLAQREVCTCSDVVADLQLAQSTVSQHLKVLGEAGLIRGEVDGQRTGYRLEPGALRRLRVLVSSL